MEKRPTESAWNPGLESEIPSRLLPLVTMFREDSASVSYPLAAELADLTGLKVLELAALKPERLVVHALLVRVTADLSVPDGPTYEVLGINLRGMVDRIYTHYMVAEMPAIVSRFDEELALARKFVSARLVSWRAGDSSAPASVEPEPTLLQKLFGKRQAETRQPVDSEVDELRALETWKQQEKCSDSPLERSCLAALIKTVGKVFAHRGRVILDDRMIVDIVVNQVGNTYGSDVINDAIEPFWRKAVEQEGYRLLPAQEKPVVMNVKGASASGKSTIRPRQRELAEKLDIPWEDFALISPDYWRKYLLDYSSLGDDFKYGAMLTGRELEIIDKKLDRYMAVKAGKGQMSHLLIDRFRFDSFTVDIDRTSDSKLLSRFGDSIYLFFMVTHPAETVERAWSRGLKTGRYKAVDDLLYHNVEAFTGMPSLFLSWVNSQDRNVHFEFLDNDVPFGQLPRTAAFGWNGTMTILDVKLLLNIDQYRSVNVAAQSAHEVFTSKSKPGSVLPKLEFIERCAKTVPEIVFADQDTGEVYAAVAHSQLHWCNVQYIEAAADRQLIEHVLASLGDFEAIRHASSERGSVPTMDIAREQRVTVGHWASH
ncbi:MAG: hypothetical protein AB8B63_08005 [Granulosicoccus sp.]